MIDENPAAFGRLCVETTVVNLSVMDDYGQPPSGGCVLKRQWLTCPSWTTMASRLRAAVC